MLFSVIIILQVIYIIRVIFIDLVFFSMFLGEMKILDFVKIMLYYVLVNILCMVQEIEINNV